MTRDLAPLLEPSSVAVIGASQDVRKPGGLILRNLLDGGFGGRMYPINPRGEEIAGLPTYRRIGDVPGRVDSAFVVVRREAVREAVAECGRAGVRSLVLITAGFAEADEWGRREQREVAELIAAFGMVAIGPNTIGLVTMGGRQRGSFVSFPSWRDGPVALCAQSGVFAGAVADDEMARDSHGLGIHASVGIGNRVDADENDFLAAFADDPHVGVVGFYLEGLADPRGFLARAAEVKRDKPVVLLKSGRTSAGRTAASSHTGALSDHDDVLDQLLTSHGVVRAVDDTDLMALLTGFAVSPVPAGPRLGVVTFSGAMGVIAADLATRSGLAPADFTAATVAEFAALLPAWQRPRNPADLWPAVDRDPREAMIGGLRAALTDPGVDQVLGILLAVPNADFDTLREDVGTLRAESPGKPLHVVVRGSLRHRWTAALDGLGVVVHPSLSEATRVLAAMTWYRRVRTVLPSAHAAATH